MVIMAVGDEGTSNMDTDIQNAMSQDWRNCCI